VCHAVGAAAAFIVGIAQTVAIAVVWILTVTVLRAVRADTVVDEVQACAFAIVQASLTDAIYLVHDVARRVLYAGDLRQIDALDRRGDAKSVGITNQVGLALAACPAASIGTAFPIGAVGCAWSTMPVGIAKLVRLAASATSPASVVPAIPVQAVRSAVALRVQDAVWTVAVLSVWIADTVVAAVGR
jgi:hypothetical protein